jgi:hypothetical protein
LQKAFDIQFLDRLAKNCSVCWIYDKPKEKKPNTQEKTAQELKALKYGKFCKLFECKAFMANSRYKSLISF